MLAPSLTTRTNCGPIEILLSAFEVVQFCTQLQCVVDKHYINDGIKCHDAEECPAVDPER